MNALKCMMHMMHGYVGAGLSAGPAPNQSNIFAMGLLLATGPALRPALTVQIYKMWLFNWVYRELF